jgi:predicted MFS family arabinose efflux permease
MNEQQQTARTVLLLSCAAFASSVALRLCDPILPELAREFETTLGWASRVVMATSIAYGIFQLLFGPLGDRFGKLRVITLACLASTVGAFACALSPSLEFLALARALNGATTAALIPLSIAWIGDAVALERRQATLAKFMSGQIVGMVSGQAIAGFFADHLGWRWAFALLGVLYLLVGVLLLGSLRGHWRARAEAHTAQPALARIRLVLNDAHARVILAVVVMEAMVTFGVIAFIPAYLHQRFGISLFHAGVVVAAIGLGGLGYTLFAQHWVGLLGQERLARYGGLLLGASFLLLALAPAWGWGLLACTTAGLGFYWLHNTLQTLATQMSPAARGTAVSLFASCFFLGQAFGVSVAGFVVDRVDAHWLFFASALVLPLVGAFLARYLGRRGGQGGAANHAGVMPRAAGLSAPYAERIPPG